MAEQFTEQFTDFLYPAIRGLSEKQSRKIAVAIDCAIVYGAMAHAQGIDKLQQLETIKEQYAENLRKLRALSQ